MGSEEKCKVVTEDRGPKDSAGKPDWVVFPFHEAQEVLKVFEYGTKKYGAAFTYRKGIPIEELLSPIIRHWVKIQGGEHFDKESGLYHASHIAANAMMILSQYQREEAHP